MHRLSDEERARGKRLLTLEEQAGGGADTSTAAGRAYDKLLAQLAPLIGTAGAELLFARSAKLLQQDFAFLADVSMLRGSAPLRERLRAADSAITAELAGALFGTFLALVTKLIGDRLTSQAVRRAWPTLDEPSTEKKNE